MPPEGTANAGRTRDALAGTLKRTELQHEPSSIPGREIVQWFEVMKPGKYEWPCAELCGFGHSGMRGWIYVHPPAEYAKWAAENLTAAATPAAEAKPEAKKPEPRKEGKGKK